MIAAPETHMPPSLGLVPLQTGTVEHDFTMLTKFQEYSAELLRLSLLGITAIGIGTQQLLFGKFEEVSRALRAWPNGRPWVFASLVFLSISTVAALWHRYSSADSLSWHLQSMRRFQSGDPAQVEKAEKEGIARHRRFRWSQRALVLAALGLGLGAITLALGLVAMLSFSPVRD
jgi:hypothetical protein